MADLLPGHSEIVAGAPNPIPTPNVVHPKFDYDPCQSLENCAIFEDWTMPGRFPIRQPESRKVAENDPDLFEALRILGLVIGD